MVDVADGDPLGETAGLVWELSWSPSFDFYTDEPDGSLTGGLRVRNTGRTGEHVVRSSERFVVDPDETPAEELAALATAMGEADALIRRTLGRLEAHQPVDQNGLIDALYSDSHLANALRRYRRKPQLPTVE
ncbi:MAG: hypothetical protein INR66_24360 [Gordonia polyisoprenivorans]|nr:hypothetical protein [Gordonia polyisoprenivorans]